MNKLKSGDTMDRLSELSDSLILKILSSLEMRDVVRTTFLSKRWNDLWTTIPCLCFVNYNISHDNVKEIRNFINQSLLLWKGSIIQKFEIRFSGDIRESLYRDMNWWLRFVMEKKVEELYLDLPCDSRSIPLPHFLYECSSIRKLSIVKCGLHIRGDVNWDQLKSLTIERTEQFPLSEDFINRVVSGAPQLEIFELTIVSDSNKSLSIRSSSLKKLSIHRDPYSNIEFDPSMYAMLTIWAPNLETLIISGAPYSKCLLMDVSSLTDVTLDFCHDKTHYVETLRQILPTFQHVEKLTLLSWSFEALIVMKGKYSFAPLPNVKLLTFEIFRAIKPNSIVGLLEIFPKLNSLEIVSWSSMYIAEPLNSEVNTIKSLMMQLRIVEIGWVKYGKSIFQFIEFFLEHATMLEKIVIPKRGFMNVQSEEMILEVEKLLSLQRSFPTVELIFCKRSFPTVELIFCKNNNNQEA